MTTPQTWVKTQVKQGDTLAKLAARHATTPQEILRANNVTPKEDQTAAYLKQRAQELKLPAQLALPVAQKVVEQDDVSVWVNDVGGNAIEITPGSFADISRFAKAPTGAYAVFAAGNVLYLPDFTANGAALVQAPPKGIVPQRGLPSTTAVKQVQQLSGAGNGLARSLALSRERLLGSYELGAVPANARVYDTTVVGDVMEIQAELNTAWGASQIHFTAGPGPSLGLDVDGDYGPNTRQAVAMFQKANGLAATGNMDAATSRKLQDDEANEIGSSTALAPVSSSGTSLILVTLGAVAVAGAGYAGYQHFKKNQKGARRRRRR